MRRGPAVILLLSLLFAAAYGSWRGLTMGWEKVTGYAPGYMTAPKPATGPPALASRLVFLMIDGLRPADAAALPTLDWLSRHGAEYQLAAGVSNYEAPELATLLTGAVPPVHGVLLPQVSAPLQADSILAAARRLHITTGAMGSQLLSTLAAPEVDQWLNPDPVKGIAGGIPLLAANGPRLVVLQTDQLVNGARRLKTANPDDPEYKDLLAALDLQLVQLVAQIDLKTTAVVVTGTALPGTGANDPVPFILAGSGIKQGVWGRGLLVDAAPTAAAIIGAPTPLETAGQPLLAALQVEGRPADVIAQQYLMARQAFTDTTLAALGSSDQTEDPPGSVQESGAYLQKLTAQVNAAHMARWKKEIVNRWPYAAALLLPLLYLLVVFRQPFGRPVFVGVVAYIALFHGIFFLLGGRYSASMAGLETAGRALAVSIGQKAAIAMGLASIVTGWFFSRKGFKYKSYLMTAGLHMALTTAVVVAIPAAAALILVGWDFPAGLPNPGLIAWFFVTTVEVITIGALGLVWSILTVNAARISRNIWPLPEPAETGPKPTAVVHISSPRRR